MGYSRNSYYRFKDLYENTNLEAWQEISRRGALLANRVEVNIEKRYGHKRSHLMANL